ncbi:hypothetical protein OLL86_02395 [Gallibacterium anatis]|uniref:hypothetical protein n=1 Tax=Gallibacterium TaxID=155493 RepID=UPI000B0DB02C|nr:MULTISPECIES: hypothetical protein [Gallibacterium]UZD16413.1 hypothetical protein OLL86_02395 [Gallibacterium anatis]
MPINAIKQIKSYLAKILNATTQMLAFYDLATKKIALTFLLIYDGVNTQPPMR